MVQKLSYYHQIVMDLFTSIFKKSILGCVHRRLWSGLRNVWERRGSVARIFFVFRLEFWCTLFVAHEWTVHFLKFVVEIFDILLARNFRPRALPCLDPEAHVALVIIDRYLQ